MTHRHLFSARAGVRAVVGLGLIVFAVQPALAGPHTPIAWRTNYEQARAEAKARDLLLWVQFTGSWCHFCQRMERETFVSPAVTSAAFGRFVPVKLRSDVHESLALHFGLSGLPSTIIIRPDGKVVARQEGYVDPTAFRAFLVGVLKREGRYGQQIASHDPGSRPESSPSASAAAGSTDGLALAGYCPVTLVDDHRLARGQTHLSVQYDGREYRFASESGRKVFLKEPEAYLPAFGGSCVVAHVDDDKTLAGDPRFGVLYAGRLYLCATEESRDRFLKEPQRYASADVAEKGFCPHCRNMRGLLVRGSPKYSTTVAGLRYYFPDPEHREAFRADPDKYLR